jgi:riboflavin synthase
MFTGLVQAIGSVRADGGDRLYLSLSSDRILADLDIGDSVAVDGVCLTVGEILVDGFVAIASPETLRRTTLGHRAAASAMVNLETSLRAGSKIGGHFVTGHVDGVGCLVESIPTASSWEMTFAAPPDLTEPWTTSIARYIVPKGSVAVNGISLTVAECDPRGSWFKVAVIPHSYEETNLSRLKLGDRVNIEGDILGKYVERLLGGRSDRASAIASGNASLPLPNGSIDEISLEFLAEHGY